jgi:DNA-binding PadR family transcriptional regulator
MIKPLPKWVMIRYAKLWNRFKDKEMTGEQIRKTLNEDNHKLINVFLSDLAKSGWLKIRLDETNRTKHIYQLVSPEQAVREIKNV